MIDLISVYMSTIFTSPEETIIKRGDQETKEMYFIISGDCVIKCTKHTKRDHMLERLLCEGDHFGEISALYDCPRTATIIGRNYNIMSYINYNSFKHILSEYPEYHNSLLSHVYSYTDERKKFIYRAVKSIDYFKNINFKDFHFLMYNMDS